ncbi:MAG: hypothetical protein ACC652_02300, partial [Acidimicrobiales bacterium]
MSSRRVLLSILVVLTLLAAACGGSSDPATSPGEVAGSGLPETSVAKAADPYARGSSIDGALVSVTSFDLGLFGLDRESGAAVAVTVDAVEFVDREQQALVSGSVSHTIGYKLIEGQSFSSDVSLVRVDLQAGQGDVIAELGQNRVNDDDASLVEWRLVGSGPSVVWLTEGDFGATEESFIAFDPTSGAET